MAKCVDSYTRTDAEERLNQLLVLDHRAWSRDCALRRSYKGALWCITQIIPPCLVIIGRKFDGVPMRVARDIVVGLVSRKQTMRKDARDYNVHAR